MDEAVLVWMRVLARVDEGGCLARGGGDMCERDGVDEVIFLLVIYWDGWQDGASRASRG